MFCEEHVSMKYSYVCGPCGLTDEAEVVWVVLMVVVVGLVEVTVVGLVVVFEGGVGLAVVASALCKIDSAAHKYKVIRKL